jgi:hypothetical protein
MAGTYSDYIEPQNDGTKSNPIWYIPYGDGEVTLKGESGVEKLVVLNNNYCHVYGMTLRYRNDTDSGNWGWVKITGTGNIIYGLNILRQSTSATWMSAIRVTGAKSTLIEGCYAKNLRIGVQFSDHNSNIIVRSCHLYNCRHHAFAFGDGGYSDQGILIDHCCMDLSRADGIQSKNPDNQVDVDTKMPNMGVIVRNCVIRYSGENGIDLKGAQHWIIENNVFYGNMGASDGYWGDPDKIHGVMGTIALDPTTRAKNITIRRNIFFDTTCGSWIGGEGWHIYNNTFAGCNRDMDGYDSDWETDTRRVGFYAVRQRYPDAERCTVVNNIMVGHNTVEFGLHDNDSSHDQYYDYNLYYNSRGGAKFAKINNSSNSWRSRTLGQWKSDLASRSEIIGGDAHSEEANPRFISGRERPNYEKDVVDDRVKKASDLLHYLDYRLQSNSPALHAGGPIDWAKKGGNNSRRLTVSDSIKFCDGLGVTEGDWIRIGSTPAVQITDIDYGSHELTLSDPRSWSDGDGVYLDYNGDGPDVGAYEMDYGAA